MEDNHSGTTDGVANTLKILEHIEEHPDTTQADLAAQVGIAIGTANWYLKRLAAKGYIKVKQLQRRRLRYMITPQGIAERTRLAISYLEVSMRLYRETREQAQLYLAQVQQAGYDAVYLQGEGDLADVCRLTCLEQKVRIQDGILSGTLPIICVSGAAVTLRLPELQELP